MKLWIRIGVYILLVSAITILTVAYTTNRKHLVDMQSQVEKQSIIIDSLLARRMTVTDIRMFVTDKSRNTIYGKYNEGVIQMPSVKQYKLEIDSIKIKQ